MCGFTCINICPFFWHPYMHNFSLGWIKTDKHLPPYLHPTNANQNVVVDTYLHTYSNLYLTANFSITKWKYVECTCKLHNTINVSLSVWNRGLFDQHQLKLHTQQHIHLSINRSWKFNFQSKKSYRWKELNVTHTRLISVLVLKLSRGEKKNLG